MERAAGRSIMLFAAHTSYASQQAFDAIVKSGLRVQAGATCAVAVGIGLADKEWMNVFGGLILKRL